MESPNFDRLNEVKPSLSTIKKLQQRHFIKQGSPLWWGIDYKIDPREYLPFDAFRTRLVHLGKNTVLQQQDSLTRKIPVERDVYLYPKPKVPMSVLEIPVGERELPFLVTARPYHPKELAFTPFSGFLSKHPLESLPDFVSGGGVLDLPDHFYPHVRGLFGGRRGNNLFWYPLHVEGWWKEFGEVVDNALKANGVSFLGLYRTPEGIDTPTYQPVWDELSKKPHLADQRTPQWVDFTPQQVSVEEFLENYQRSQDLLFFYPLTMPEMETTLPLVIANRTNKGNLKREPVVLGIYAENGLSGFCRRGGICRIKSKDFAGKISALISQDLGIEIKTVLFTPQPGRAKYEKV